MNKNQKQIRKLIIIAFVVIGLLSGLVSLKIELPKSKEKSKQTGQFEVHEIRPFSQPGVLSGAGAETLTGESVSAQAGALTDSPVTTVPSVNNADSQPGADAQNNNLKPEQDSSTKAVHPDTGVQQDQAETGSQITPQQQNPSSVSTVQGSTNQQQAASGQQDTVQITNEPVETKPEKEYITCTIEIRCDALSNDLSALTDENLKQYIPADGTILASTALKVEKGASVYDVLLQVCQNHSIQLDTNYTPMYKNYYVKSIQYLYEKKAGQNSGWRYMVNGIYPNYGCSSYKLQQGDVVVWEYSLDLGT